MHAPPGRRPTVRDSAPWPGSPGRGRSAHRLRHRPACPSSRPRGQRGRRLACACQAAGLKDGAAAERPRPARCARAVRATARPVASSCPGVGLISTFRWWPLARQNAPALQRGHGLAGIGARMPGRPRPAAPARPLRSPAAAVAVGGALQRGVVQQKQHAIAAELGVALEHAGSYAGRPGEGGQGVLRAPVCRRHGGRSSAVGARVAVAYSFRSFAGFWLNQCRRSRGTICAVSPGGGRRCPPRARSPRRPPCRRAGARHPAVPTVSTWNCQPPLAARSICSGRTPGLAAGAFFSRFAGGEPMKPATKVFGGLR